MGITLTAEQATALKALQEGLLHIDRYNTRSLTDDQGIYLAPGDGSSLYEFATESGVVSLGHLRDLAKIGTVDADKTEQVKDYLMDMMMRGGGDGDTLREDAATLVLMMS